MDIYNRAKIGNLFVYLCDNIDNLYLTKLMKLIYIIDETSVKETGSPVTWFDYKVWRMGPVPKDIYTNISYKNGDFFSDFIDVDKIELTNGNKITSNNTFDDSEFSDYEIELMDRVIDEYGKYTSEELIQLLHESDSLWHQVVIENNLKKDFENQKKNTTDFNIDIEKAITDNFLKEMYLEMRDNILFAKKVRSENHA